MAKRQDWEGVVYKFDVPTDGTNYGIATHNRVWDTNTLQWVSMTQPGGGTGGGGTQYAQGSTVATPTGTVALAQNPSNVLNALKTDASGNLAVNLAAGSGSFGRTWTLSNATDSVAVTGTFWQATQPVSGSLGRTWTLSSGTDSVAVTGTFWQATQPVSIAAAVNTKPDGTTWALTGTSANVNVTNSSIAVTGTFWQATQPVSGSLGRTWALSSGTDSVAVTGTFWQATQPVSVAATVATKETQPTTASLTSVSASITSVSLLSSNASRRQATVYNDSSANLYLALGGTASTSAFTLIIAGGGYYELPQPVYTGAISGVWASATGAARITELT